MLLTTLTYTGLLILNKTPFLETQKINNIIAEKFKEHPTIRFSHYDINSNYNKIYIPPCPERRPSEINLQYNYKYNKYIENFLDKLFMNNKYTEDEMCKLNKKLRNIIIQKLRVYPYVL